MLALCLPAKLNLSFASAIALPIATGIAIQLPARLAHNRERARRSRQDRRLQQDSRDKPRVCASRNEALERQIRPITGERVAGHRTLSYPLIFIYVCAARPTSVCDETGINYNETDITHVHNATDILRLVSLCRRVIRRRLRCCRARRVVFCVQSEMPRI